MSLILDELPDSIAVLLYSPSLTESLSADHGQLMTVFELLEKAEAMVS